MATKKNLSAFSGMDLKKLKEEIFENWKKSGLLDGLKGTNKFDWIQPETSCDLTEFNEKFKSEQNNL